MLVHFFSHILTSSSLQLFFLLLPSLLRTLPDSVLQRGFESHCESRFNPFVLNALLAHDIHDILKLKEVLDEVFLGLIRFALLVRLFRSSYLITTYQFWAQQLFTLVVPKSF